MVADFSDGEFCTVASVLCVVLFARCGISVAAVCVADVTVVLPVGACFAGDAVPAKPVDDASVGVMGAAVGVAGETVCPLFREAVFGVCCLSACR